MKKILICLIILIFSTAIYAGEKLWTKPFDKDIEWIKVTELGSLLAATKEKLYCLDPATGEIKWEKEQKKLPEQLLEFVSGTPIFFIPTTEGFAKGKAKLTAYNLDDGKVLWETDNFEGFSLGVFPIFSKDFILMFVSQYNMGGGDISAYAIDMATGNIKWKKDKIVDKTPELYEAPGSGKIFKKFGLKGGQQPIIDGDEIIFAFPNVIKFSLNDGSMIYKSDVDISKGDVAPQQGYANWISEDDMIFMPNGRRVIAISKKDGKLKWESEKQKEKINQIINDGEKLILKGVDDKGKGFINAINKQSGQNLWKDRFKIEAATNIINQADGILLVSDKKFYKLDKSTGNILFESKLKKLQDNNINYLKEFKDAIYAVGSQNVAKLNKINGDIEWEQYYEAPGSSGWAKFGAFAFSAVMYVAASSQAMNSYAGTSENRWANDARKESWGAFNEVMKKRFHASSASGNFLYFLAKLADGPGLVGVNLETGKKEREIFLNTKKPNYKIDEIEGRAFNIIDDNKLEGFAF